jgi:hypothetical protein
LFSAVLVIVGLWFRLRVTEAEEFLQAQRTRSTVRYPLLLVVRRYWRTVGVGVAVTLVCHAAYVLTTFLPGLRDHAIGGVSTWSLVGLISASALGVVVLAVVARRADRSTDAGTPQRAASRGAVGVSPRSR